MSRLKNIRLSIFNKLLSLPLTLLGFPLCDRDTALMYGTPPAKYDVKTNVPDECDTFVEDLSV